MVGGEPEDERGDGPGDAHGAPHGQGRVLQELRRQAGLDVRVRYWWQPAVQGGARDSREGPGAGVQRDRRAPGQWLSDFMFQILYKMCFLLNLVKLFYESSIYL